MPLPGTLFDVLGGMWPSVLVCVYRSVQHAGLRILPKHSLVADCAIAPCIRLISFFWITWFIALFSKLRSAFGIWMYRST